MRFRDAVILRLLDPDMRDGVLDGAAAEALALAAFPSDAVALEPPFVATAASVEPGLALDVSATGSLQAILPNQPAPVTARFELDAPAGRAPVVVDALWHGSVSAVGASAPARIDRVAGSLTGGEPGAFNLHFQPEGDLAPRPMALAITAAILVDDPEDADRGLGALFARLRRARSALAAAHVLPPGTRPAPRPDIPVVLIMPEARLDDALWPGAAPAAPASAARAQRLARGNAWSTGLGIVLATGANPP